ncbi:MAG: ComEA family DNA-binding protein [Ilyomonas sp.]
MNRTSWKDYFTFSQKERVAVVILLIIIFVAVILPFFIRGDESKPISNEQLKQQIAQLRRNNNQDTDAHKEEIETVSFQSALNNKTETRAPVLFDFDPNRINEEGWRKLGVTDKTIQTILHYRSKGGRFKQPEDIRKIYGLKEEKANELIPYIKIKPKIITDDKPEEIPQQKTETAKIESRKKIETIDINTATVEQWKALPMIGDVLSNRIVKFRNKIGGFKSIEQVKQTYGLSDSAFAIIRPYLRIDGKE